MNFSSIRLSQLAFTEFVTQAFPAQVCLDLYEWWTNWSHSYSGCHYLLSPLQRYRYSIPLVNVFKPLCLRWRVQMASGQKSYWGTLWPFDLSSWSLIYHWWTHWGHLMTNCHGTQTPWTVVHVQVKVHFFKGSDAKEGWQIALFWPHYWPLIAANLR